MKSLLSHFLGYIINRVNLQLEEQWLLMAAVVKSRKLQDYVHEPIFVISGLIGFFSYPARFNVRAR